MRYKQKLRGAVAAVLLLGATACASGQGPTPLSTVLAVESTLSGANKTFLVYEKLAPCTGTNGPLCADPAVVVQGKTASRQAYNAVVAAQTAVKADPKASSKATSAVLLDMQASMSAFTAFTATLPATK